jgi:RNA polymerase III transcription factor (TF)IIIC subunit HTH domain
MARLHYRIDIRAECVPSAPTIPNVPDRLTSAVAYFKHKFEERPAWSRRALMFEAPQSARSNFKTAIPLVAYAFANLTGPFHMLWLKYGFDPRADKSARKYQVIEIRLSDPVVLESMRRRWGTGEGNGGGAMLQANNECAGNQTVGDLPSKRQLTLQICDIDAPGLDILLDDDDNIRTTFDQATGFLTRQGIAVIIELTKDRVLEHAVVELGETVVKDVTHRGSEKGKLSGLGREYRARGKNKTVPIAKRRGKAKPAAASVPSIWKAVEPSASLVNAGVDRDGEAPQHYMAAQESYDDANDTYIATARATGRLSSNAQQDESDVVDAIHDYSIALTTHDDNLGEEVPIRVERIDITASQGDVVPIDVGRATIDNSNAVACFTAPHAKLPPRNSHVASTLEIQGDAGPVHHVTQEIGSSLAHHVANDADGGHVHHMAKVGNGEPEVHDVMADEVQQEGSIEGIEIYGDDEDEDDSCDIDYEDDDE